MIIVKKCPGTEKSLFRNLYNINNPIMRLCTALHWHNLPKINFAIKDFLNCLVVSMIFGYRVVSRKMLQAFYNYNKIK